MIKENDGCSQVTCSLLLTSCSSSQRNISELISLILIPILIIEKQSAQTLPSSVRENCFIVKMTVKTHYKITILVWLGDYHSSSATFQLKSMMWNWGDCEHRYESLPATEIVLPSVWKPCVRPGSQDQEQADCLLTVFLLRNVSCCLLAPIAASRLNWLLSRFRAVSAASIVQRRPFQTSHAQASSSPTAITSVMALPCCSP